MLEIISERAASLHETTLFRVTCGLLFHLPTLVNHPASASNQKLSIVLLPQGRQNNVMTVPYFFPNA
jgi:hypothetical protein